MGDENRNFISTVNSLMGPASEVLKQQQDYYKALSALNATTLLITIAFADKIVRTQNSMPFILVPFAFFTASLLCSLFMMKIFGEFHAYFFGIQQSLVLFVVREDKDLERFKGELDPVQKKMATLGRQANRFQGPVIWLYTFGILTLLIMAIISLVPAGWFYFLGILALLMLVTIFQYDVLKKIRERKNKHTGLKEATGPGPKPPGPGAK